MSENSSQDNSSIDQAVAEGGSYEVLRRRLTEEGKRLEGLAEQLNQKRLEEFGDTKMEIAGRMRIRSEHNAVGRDIVQVGGMLLFGYNVFLGLKGTTSVADVFSLYKLVEVEGDGYDVTPVDLAGTFLADPGFVRDFNELYSYYKDAKLTQLMVKDSKLLASFQIGLKVTDVRVFRWSVSSTGDVAYMDMRGERDIAPPPAFDFEWQKATKDQEVSGRFPHLNILDTLFVETTGGDLTIKVENNTETGSGIYSEPVEDKTQSLDDAQVEYAQVGSLVLLKVLPYRETKWRGLVYNKLTNKVVRLDAIVQACVQLPEDHGIIFPGGYYLQNGDHKKFDASMADMAYKRHIPSPNGEDVLYVFYDRISGTSALLVYNMVRREIMPPIFAHGYARLGDGRMVLFHAENDNPTRVHQMQVWNTPFFSDDFAAARPVSTTPLGRIGNAELVRAISDMFDLVREINQENVSAARYQGLADASRKMFDAHHWVSDDVAPGLPGLLHAIASTSESVIDEFEKVQQMRSHSDKSLAQAREEYRNMVSRTQPEGWSHTQEFVDGLNAIAALRGKLMTIREYRYIDVDAIDQMSKDLEELHQKVGDATGAFLADPKAIEPLDRRLAELDAKAGKAETAKELAEITGQMGEMSGDLDMLSGLMASLRVDDATQRTRVVEALSGLYARLNQARARAEQRRKALGGTEAVAQFGAQFALFSQSVSSALGMAQTPEKSDEQLSRLLVQLEELENQFGEHDQFLSDILSKREELLETFESHKQALLDDRQRKAQSVSDAALRILEGLGRRTERFKTADELNAFFVSDALIQKIRDLVSRLRELRDSVRADDIESKVKAARDQAVRALRDRSDLFEAGGDIIRLGPRHRFSVNTQPLDLTLLPRGEDLALHLTGTDYIEPIRGSQLDAYRAFWSVSLESESDDLYRAEYLACQVLRAALDGVEGQDWNALLAEATDTAALSRRVREFAASRYRDGYEKGIHDHDAALLLHAMVSLYRDAGVLVHSPGSRALAISFWQNLSKEDKGEWASRVYAARTLDEVAGSSSMLPASRQELIKKIQVHLDGRSFPFAASAQAAADYLIACIQDPTDPVFEIGQGAEHLVRALEEALPEKSKKALDNTINQLASRPDEALSLVSQALLALCFQPHNAPHERLVPEAAVVYFHKAVDATKPQVNARPVRLSETVKGLLGQHDLVKDGQMEVAIDDILARYNSHVSSFVPQYRQYQEKRAGFLAQSRQSMRLEEFKPKPLTSFVRNKLINEIYLPVIGDNLAKQMGTVGEDKRSDLMGLLMMISPPGYGKTTLMEYVASRLGLIFMKINGPALGHDVKSVDPGQAPDATSRQELEKLNLALEMGNNVMLYVDDIQHTNPEFLQKFISLCDGTRRIEGVWKGQTKTYDMRGKKFCVVMAGNPYTESGEVFKIPDMLANRADIYNLGDVLGGMEDAFLSSYIENSLTSNPVLAPLATRDLSDLYVLMDKAAGKEVSTNTLKHPYGAAEINEIVAVLERMIKVRDIVYRVNQQYIASAAQDDRYRVEPAFKLQGSYRNMNKLAEKIYPAMNDDELQQLISDHYLGESQLLTTGAEENLLKLAELRGVMSDEQKARWEQIKADFLRNKAMGGADDDVGGRVVAQLADIADGLRGMAQASRPDPEQAEASRKAELDRFQMLSQSIMALAEERGMSSSQQPQAVSAGGLDEERWEAMMQALLAAVSRPVQVRIEGGQAPQAPASRAKAKPAQAAEGEPRDAAPVQPQATPQAAALGVSDDAISNLASALAQSNKPLVDALTSRSQENALIGSALAAIMLRLSGGDEGKLNDMSGTPKVRGQMTEFEKILANLVFNYDRNRR